MYIMAQVELVELIPGVNIFDEHLPHLENTVLYIRRKTGRGPQNDGVETIRVDHARILYKPSDAEPEKKVISGMYVMGTVEQYRGPHVDRVNKTSSPEKFRPGTQVSYNSDDYIFKINNLDTQPIHLKHKERLEEEGPSPERTTMNIGVPSDRYYDKGSFTGPPHRALGNIRNRTKSKKPKRKTKSKKPKRKTKSKKPKRKSLRR